MYYTDMLCIIDDLIASVSLGCSHASAVRLWPEWEEQTQVHGSDDVRPRRADREHRHVGEYVVVLPCRPPDCWNLRETTPNYSPPCLLLLLIYGDLVLNLYVFPLETDEDILNRALLCHYEVLLCG